MAEHCEPQASVRQVCLPAGGEAGAAGVLPARVNEVLGERNDRAAYVSDLCSALQIGERSLRQFFLAVYGTSPARYLRLRRLQQARRALRDPESRASVTEIGTTWGFFDLGRFASDSRALFGEPPSRTLREARGKARR